MNSLRRRFLRPLLWGALALFAPAAGWTAHAAALRHAATPRASFRSAVRLASNALGARPRLTGLTLRTAAAAPASPPTATPLYTFLDGSDGGDPSAPLVQGSDGNFYGTTKDGGDNGFGAVFQMTPSGTIKPLASFSEAGGFLSISGLIEGLNPDGSPNGTFFGTCEDGGPTSRRLGYSFGSVFKLAPDSNSPTGFTLTYIYEFPGTSATDTAQGANPFGSLVPGRNADGTFDGFYYGTTKYGGSGDASTTPGTVYKITANGAETVIHQFQVPTTPETNSNYYMRVNADGYFPTSSLVQARNADGTYQDAFLGTTGSGGANGVGTVFQVSREDNFTDVYDFTGGSDGGAPYSGLTRGQDGDYYGLTTTGSSLGHEDIYHITAFRLVPDTSSPTGYTFRTIVDLSSVAGSSQPYASSGNSVLTQASDGNFYANGDFGGSANFGAVYRIAPDTSSPTGFSATDVFTFTGGAMGSDLRAPVIQAADGDLYGTTDALVGGGTIYRLNLGLPLPTTTKQPPAAIAPTISSMSYYGPSGSAQGVIISGDHFVNGATVTVDGAAATSVTFENAQGLVGYLSQKLPGGSHTVVVTNPNGQLVSATLTILNAPTIADGGATSYTIKNGTVYLVVSGSNFGTPGYNGSADGLQVDVTDAAGGLVPATLVVRAAAPAQPGGPQQVVATLDTSVAVPGKLTAVIINGDGQSSAAVPFEVYSKDQTQYAVSVDPSLLFQAYQLYLQAQGTPAASPTDASASSADNTSSPSGAVRQAQGRSLRPNALGDPTQITGNVSYQVNPDGTATITANGVNFVPGGFVVVTNASAGTSGHVTLHGDSQSQVGNQIIDILSQALPPGNHDITHVNPDGQTATGTFSVAASSPTFVVLGQVSITPPVLSTAITASGNGTSTTGLISQDGNGLISQDGNGLISQDGNGLISQDGNGLISQDGNGLISQDGNGIVAQRAGNIVAEGTGIISRDGAGIISRDGAGLITNAVAALASSAGVTGSLGLTPQFAPTAQARTARAASATPLSFILTKHDAGTARGTGSSDLKVRLNHTDGTSTFLLDLRFTPGQPDVVVYQAPGVTLTPRLGTTAPAVTSPAPTLTAVSPNTAPVGGNVTLTATGTFFTTGTVINFNGQALATTVVSGTQATAVVPAAMLTSAGPASVTVTNPAPGGGTSASLPFTIIAPTHLFAGGLQMFSVPADYSALALTQALTMVAPRLAVWQPIQAQYAITPTSPADALRPGQGYWARFTVATGIVGPGVPTRTDQAFSIALATGWNMIGDPFPSAVPLSGIQVQDASGSPLGSFSQGVTAGAVSGTLYTYGASDTQYQAVHLDGSLSPYVGDWVYAYRPCTLQVPVPLSPD